MAQEKKVREAQVVYQVSEVGTREPVVMLPIANLDLRLTAQITVADNQWTAYCPEIDLATAADTQELAITELAQLAAEYAAEYLADFDLYVNSPNRSSHLPHILAIARYTTSSQDREAIQALCQHFVVEPGWVTTQSVAQSLPPSHYA
jgi:Antitoxin of toxin-antitoxin, RelE / RelB, TA system